LSPICLHDKKLIETLLREDDVPLHLYEIGDLEEPFWQHTTWYSLPHKGPRPVLLIYSGLSLPALLALTKRYPDLLKGLLRAAMPLLPCKFYAHLSPGQSSALEEFYDLEPRGEFFKMSLQDPSRLEGVDTSEVVSLGPRQAEELQRFYEESYPGHWFEPHMLQTGFYYGIRRDSRLVCAAGVHVYSPPQQVAAVGNVATHPRYRNHGLARAACARLCRDLLKTVSHIGLNVNKGSAAAIACYRMLGFEPAASYEEHMIERKR
jgi:ribosomal protein S18 acetylase RimI-like enzyme